VSEARPSDTALPCIAVYSSLFPSQVQPTAGLFIRERMFRVGAHAPLVVVSPQPWFPFQGLMRLLRPGYRPAPASSEVQQGVTVLFPRFLAVPGLFRAFDGLSMALCTYPLLRRLKRERGVAIVDAHFAFPCGAAAVHLGRWLRLPVSITLRGSETRQLRDACLRPRLLAAMHGATRVFSVSDSLRQLMIDGGVDPDHIQVIGNGVDLVKFRPIPRDEARRRLGLHSNGPVLVTVGGLVERKGFHRVLELMPRLIEQFPTLHYLIVGGPSPEGDMTAVLREQVRTLGLERCVTFTGPLPPEDLHIPLSAADIFVLPTRNEGWANVFLEAMACGLPVVTTAVGGNAEVVNSPALGYVVPFGDANSLHSAITAALGDTWDQQEIIRYARSNTWDKRVEVLVDQFRRLTAPHRSEKQG
jgi:glycosyltransferase involved in cell wall biosynthesis